MANILDYLNIISKAVYGKDVRQAIVNAISTCYEDGKAGVNDLEARKLIESAIGVNESQQADIDTLYAQIAEIQSGGGESSQESTSITLDTIIFDGGFVDSVKVNNNATATYDVTFSKTFTEVPEVFACVAVQNAASSVYSKVTVGLVKSQITTTGFRFFIANTSGATRSTTVVWAAFQPTTKTIDLDITIPSGDGMTEAQVREITNPIQTALNGVKTGYDGTVYSTPGEAVRTQINDLHVLIGDEPGTAIDASAIGYGEDSNVEDALAGLNERLGGVENALGIVLNENNVTTTSRMAYFPFDFINGHKYVIELKNSDQTVSGIRITSAKNLNTDSIVQGYSVNNTEAKLNYECNSDNGKWLVVYCPSSVTSFTCSVAVYDSGIIADIYNLKVNVSVLQDSAVQKYITPAYVDNEYVKTDGTFEAYNGWSRTDFVDISTYTNFVVDAGTASTSQTYIYNAFYSDKTPESFVSKFTLGNGVNDVKIPQDAKYAVLSNTSLRLKTQYKISGYIDVPELRTGRNISAEEVPAYSIDYLDSKTLAVMNQIMNGKANSDTFAFYTDTHFPANSGESGRYMSYLLGKLPAKKAFFGGDVCPAYSSSYSGATSEEACTKSIADQFSAINKKISAFELFQCKGNHDFHVSSQTDSSDKYMMNPQQSRNIVMGGSDLANLVTNNNDLSASYYYVDNPSQNIRYVVMDSCERFGENNQWVQTYGMSDTQIEWIAEQAINTGLGLNFVFISHVGLVDMTCSDATYQRYARILNIIKALNSHNTVSDGGNVYDFTAATGRVMCVITGHEHQDLITYDDGIPNVSVACDAMYQDYQKSFIYQHFNAVPPAKSAGSINEVTFDIVHVDNEVIRFNRIGGGGNRYLHLEKRTANVGESITINAGITGTIEWWCYDSNGRSVSSDWIFTPSTARASVNNGVVTCNSAGEVVVVAKNENGDFEFFDVMIT